MESKYKVFVTNYRLKTLEYEEKILSKVNASLIPIQTENEDEMIELIYDADAILNSSALITRRVIESLKKCRVIVYYGIGVDSIDIKAATERGILVANVPDYCMEEVSNHTIALILALNRKVFLLNNYVKKGLWDINLVRPIERISEQTLGIIGFGKIPKSLIPKAKVLGFNIIVYVRTKRKYQEWADFFGVQLVDLKTLLQTSDYISIHIPLTDQTRGLIGENELRMMKKTAYIINMARGPVVDEPALYKALKEGWIAGAGLDVLTKEPHDLDNPLLEMDNVIITPHIAWYSEGSNKELRQKAAYEVLRVLEGELPKSIVNLDVIKNKRFS